MIPRRWLASFADWMVASDPGLARLRFASRTTTTVALALGATYGFAVAAGEPMMVMAIGIVTALLTTVAVNDASDRDKKITLLLVPLPAAATLVLGALAADARWVGDALFIGIVFAAVYVRRFGARGSALGMIAFITYFLALFLRVRLLDLPAYMAALVIGLICSFVMRFVVWPDRPALLLRRTLRALEAQMARVIDELLAVIESGRLDDAHRRTLRRRFVHLNNTAMTAEGHADRVRDSSRAPSFPVPAPLQIFELELAVEHMAAVVLDPAILARPATPTRQALRQLQQRLRRAPHGADSATEALASSADDNAVQRAMADLAAKLAALRQPGAAAPPQREPASGAGEGSPSAAAKRSRLLPSTRQAIQAAAAGLIAVAAGEMVSTNRWYWAAITAFIVFTGTTSRGDILIKGWQRLAGTLAGVGAGVFLATFVHGERALSVALIFGCIFLAFYLIQVSYGLMIFWITIVLALLYGLMGAFSPALLLLRLEETAVGAAAGMLVALWLLPTRTRSHVRTASADYLQAVINLLNHDSERHPADWSESARALDRRFQALRTAARPLTRGVAGMFSRRSARRWMRAMLALRHHSRHFARARAQLDAEDADDALRRETDAVREHIEVLASRIGGQRAPDSPATPLTPARSADAETGNANDTGQRQAARAALRRIDQIVHNLERDFFDQ